jgi:LacI family transcriptional regulator
MDPRRNILVLGNRNPFTMQRLLSGMASHGPTHRSWSFNVVERLEAERRNQFREDISRSDGVVAVGLEADALDQLLSLGRPVVGVHLDDPRIPCFNVDDRAVGRLAAEHLIGRGFQRFGFYGPPELEASRARLGTLREALGEAGLAPPEIGPGGAEGRWWPEIADPASIRPWLEGLDPPTGIVAFNDQIGASIVHAAEDLGRSLPEEIAVVGVDNTEMRCEFLAVQLSSVDPNIRQIGYEAAVSLEALMRAEPVAPGPRTVAPLGVVARESTDTTVTADESVRRAARLIRSRACDGLTYEELMEEFRISRRTLERRFRSALGRTIGQEIRRVRLEAAREMLRRTDLPLADIAARTGFEYMSYLSRAFKRAFGENPSDFRARNRR